MWSAYPEAFLKVGIKHWQYLPFLLISIWALQKDYRIRKVSLNSEGVVTPPQLPPSQQWLPSGMDEGRIYSAIANEIDTGTTDKGLWTRLFVECDGDENKTKVRYIKQRFQGLLIQERERLETGDLCRTPATAIPPETITSRPVPNIGQRTVKRTVAILFAVIAIIAIAVHAGRQPEMLINLTAEQGKDGERRAKPWKQVVESKFFKTLSSTDQEKARKQYFREVVVPIVGIENIDEARKEFDADTAPTVWNKIKLLLNLNR